MHRKPGNLKHFGWTSDTIPRICGHSSHIPFHENNRRNRPNNLRLRRAEGRKTGPNHKKAKNRPKTLAKTGRKTRDSREFRGILRSIVKLSANAGLEGLYIKKNLGRGNKRQVRVKKGLRGQIKRPLPV